jgi:hypothetical protein
MGSGTSQKKKLTRECPTMRLCIPTHYRGGEKPKFMRTSLSSSSRTALLNIQSATSEFELMPNSRATSNTDARSEFESREDCAPTSAGFCGRCGLGVTPCCGGKTKLAFILKKWTRSIAQVFLGESANEYKSTMANKCAYQRAG